MRTSVRVDGHDLEEFGPVSELEDSTIWRDEGYSGDYEFSCTWAPPAGFTAPWLRAGASVVIVEGGLVVWSGFLGEPDRGDVWRLTGFGWGAEAAQYRSTELSAVDMNDNVDAATSRGAGFDRWSNDLTGGSWALATGADSLMLDAALDKVAKSLGKVWWVSLGELSLRSGSTGVDWLMAPNSAYLGTTDENLVTSLTGRYVDSVDGSGDPATWDTETVDDAAAADKFRPHEREIDLTALGLISSATALDIVEARFAYVGARSGWTNPFEMTLTNSFSAVNDVPNPMGVRAGHRIRITGLTDMFSGVTYRDSTIVTAGKVRRFHDEQRVSVEPVGMVARDFSGALSAAQAPATPRTLEVL